MKNRTMLSVRFPRDEQALYFDKICLKEIENHFRTDFGSYIKDGRTNAEYIYDLVYGWFMEEKFEYLLKKVGKVERQGVDKDYSIKKVSKVKGTPDFLLHNRYHIEYQISEHTRDTYDVKEHKVKKMRKDPDILLVFYIVELDKYMLLTAKSFEGMNPQYNFAWKKQAFKIKPRDLFTQQQLVAKLKQLEV